MTKTYEKAGNFINKDMNIILGKEDMISKDELLNALHNGVVELRFTKNDGSERLINATLMKERVEPLLRYGQKKITDEYIPVVDVDLDDWRAFRYDALESVTLKDAA